LLAGALKIRVVNVVDLMKLQSQSEHPHGLSDTDYDALFTKDKLIEHKVYINQHGEDMAGIRNWKWPGNTKGGTKTIKPRAELETAHDG
jgi:phosphoketolase